MPDSPESRLNKLETAVEVARSERESNRRQIETIAPLVTEFAALRERLEDTRDDVRQTRADLMQEMRDLRADQDAARKRDREELEGRLTRAVARGEKTRDEFQRSIQNQVLECNSRVTQFEHGLVQERKDLVTARRNLNLALIAGIFAIAASLISSILPGLLG